VVSAGAIADSAGSPLDPAMAEQLHRVPRRHYVRGTAVGLLIALLVSMMIHGLIVNPNFEWRIVGHYLFASSVLQGLRTTIELTAIAMSGGIVLGIILALFRQSSDPWLRGCSTAYIWFFRGTPLLVQLLFWFNVGALYQHLSVGIPYGPALFSVSSNSITPLAAAILGLGFNEAAYMTEIVRGGILSVGKGQTDAALAIGMRRRQAFVRIVMPQAMRVIVPATGNQVIGMLKTTSLVSVIGLAELLYSVQIIYAANFQPIPLLLVACLWYLAATTVLSLGQRQLERRLGRGFVPAPRIRLRNSIPSQLSSDVPIS
jgi:polar amino acid transport system permease protein